MKVFEAIRIGVHCAIIAGLIWGVASFAEVVIKRDSGEQYSKCNLIVMFAETFTEEA